MAIGDNVTSLSIIIPVHNESLVLRSSLAEFTTQARSCTEDYEIIVIDDGSTDDTWSVLTDCSVSNPNVVGYRFTRNFGKDNALAAGLHHAQGAAVIIIDADLEHPPSLIQELYRHWKSGDSKIIEAVRESTPTTSLLRRSLATVHHTLFNRLTGLNLTHATDCKLLDRSVVKAWKALAEREVFFKGLVPWLGFSTLQVPFTPVATDSRKSRWSYRKLFQLSLQSILSFSNIPLYLIPVLGIVFLFFSILLGIVVLSQWLMGTAVEGFTTVIILQLFIGGIVMCSLGIIGLYLSKLYMEVKSRPRYIISERIGGGGKL
jgi:glycosyltransferase involved in cell wall biosynthesis